MKLTRLLPLFLLGWFALAAPAAAQSRAEIEQAMKRATEFMTQKVAHRGGYVWSYLPDMSRRWGELEAYPTMIWVQPPGTPTVGHLFLDAYHATGDDYYYRAAEQVAAALIAGQHRSGGWNYLIDFAGPASEKRWYETIGRNAWRMEEFHYYADNATFDDLGTIEASQFLLRMYFEKRDRRYRGPLDKAIAFVLDSEIPGGGWPQRWPADPRYPAYQSFITFNDDVAAENVKFLRMVEQAGLGSARTRAAIRRGMDIYLKTQLPPPQAGWALQYTRDLKPAAARSYEPNALATHTTGANVEQLMNFYRQTGDRRYLAPIPAALAWLETVRLPSELHKGNRQFPTFVEFGTNRPIYVHRRGSNVVNGRYYWDYDPNHTLGHYSGFRNVDVAKLRGEYERLRAAPWHPPASEPLPRYFVGGLVENSDLNAVEFKGSTAELIAALNAQGYWPTPLTATSNPYAGPGPATPVPGDYRTTHVGDSSDTSPYPTDKPVTGISTAAYIANMAALIRALEAQRAGERG